jgi:phage gpG-like protein
MPPRIKIELTEEARETLRAVQALPDRMLVAIAAAMDKENWLTVAHIDTERMKQNGGKPFPPEEHILGVRTGRYRASLRASEATVGPCGVESSIGSNVVYAAVHEFGARIEHEARSGTARLRTDNRGALLRQAGYENLALFARAGHKQVKAVPYQSGAHTVEIPARAPVTTGIQDRLEDYRNAISEACVTAWKSKS